MSNCPPSSHHPGARAKIFLLDLNMQHNSETRARSGGKGIA